MSRKYIGLAAALLLIGACSSDPDGENNSTATNNFPADMGMQEDDSGGNNGAPDADNGGDDSGQTNAGNDDMGGEDPEVTIENPDDCYEFSNDVDIPLAIDGAFAADSPVWRRPHDEPPVCPATALLPETSAMVPYVGFKFCNTDAEEHTYDFEFLGEDGPAGEPPLADPYLLLYEGEGLPEDHLQCLAVNDDIPGAIDTGDSEILGVTVPAGGAITVMATTFTFDPNDGTGTGGYVLVVSNAD